jgi:hypothetical protein
VAVSRKRVAVAGMSGSAVPAQHAFERGRRALDRSGSGLRASVQIATRCTCQTSKAWPSSSSFASVLTALRCAETTSQVPPISTSSGSVRSSGHAGCRNLVQPTTVWSSAARRCTNGAASPGGASSSSPDVGGRLVDAVGYLRVAERRSIAGPATAIASTCSSRSGSSVTCRPVSMPTVNMFRGGCSSIPSSDLADRRSSIGRTGLPCGDGDTTTMPATVTIDDLFDTLDDPAVGSDRCDDGTALEVLHDREYRVRAFRKRDDLLLIRGAVRDQKPPGLYIEIDPDPLTIHHMQIDIEVAFPSLEIVAANVAIETHPHEQCPRITESHYDKLVGLSIARGFTHKVRELFGGPRGCTHTTALLQAMAPVAIQCMWSMRASQAKRSGAATAQEPSPEQREMAWRFNLNTCHVWAEDGEQVQRLQAGGEFEPPIWARERMVELGLKPDAWRERMRG